MDTETPTRPAPPDLEFRAPDCPFCFKETSSDGDCYYCEVCGTAWGQTGRDGEWSDPEAPQCEAVSGQWLPGGISYDYVVEHHPELTTKIIRCIRSEDHEGEHSDDGVCSWPDKYSATPEQLASVPA